MKKMLQLVAAISMTAPLCATAIACGGDGKTITYAYVNNGTDKDASQMFKDLESKYYEIYGDSFKLKGVAYQDENSLPEDILKVGNASAPDVFGVNVDAANKLATNNAILALEGADAPAGADQIIKNLNYDEEVSSEALQKYKEDEDSLTPSEKWSTWLPYAVKASKIKSNNASSKESKAVQYGITKHLGVGGATAVVSTSENSIKAFKDLGMLNGENKLPDGGLDWNANADGFTIDELVKWTSEQANATAQNSKDANGFMPFMLDRGMWWMYPVYANIISDEIGGTVYKAADIGMNWLNDKDLPYYDESDGKYSSLWSNKYFKTSREEVVSKWFDLFAQQFKVAKNTLTNGSEIAEKPENLLDPTNNAAVQANMIAKGFTGGVNYEPGSYFDMLKGFKSFTNMDYVGLDQLQLFGDGEKEKYEKEGLNHWMAPAGSGMMVFNTKLGSNSKKLRAAQQWVELMFGVSEEANSESGEAELKFDNEGGVFNFNQQFSKLADNPAKIAILDESLRETDAFKKALESKVDVKYNRAINEDSEFKKSIADGTNKIEDEKAAIFRLESLSIRLAASLYGEDNVTMSWAPNVSSYDTATDNDWHGNNAMKPSLLKALKINNFEEVFGEFGDKNVDYMNVQNYQDARATFVNDLITKLAELNKNQSEQN